MLLFGYILKVGVPSIVSSSYSAIYILFFEQFEFEFDLDEYRDF